MSWSVNDFVELLDAADLPEALVVLAAWWEPVGSGGCACGMVVSLVDGTLWYLECLWLDDEPSHARPRKAKATERASRPKSKVLVSSLQWNVPAGAVTAELDRIYCRSKT